MGLLHRRTQRRNLNGATSPARCRRYSRLTAATCEESDCASEGGWKIAMGRNEKQILRPAEGASLRMTTLVGSSLKTLEIGDQGFQIGVGGIYRGHAARGHLCGGVSQEIG